MDDVNTHTEQPIGIEITTPAADTVQVSIAGELDLSTIQLVESQAAQALAGRPARLIIDASALDFADSSAIALWLRWASQVEHFELRNLSPLLRRVLAAMGLEGRLELSP